MTPITDNIDWIDNDYQYGFKYREIKTSLSFEQQIEKVNTVTHNAIFFILEGELHISWEGQGEIVVRSGELYFLPRGAIISAFVSSGLVKYIVVRIDRNLNSTKSFNDLISNNMSDFNFTYNFSPLKIVEPLHNFLCTVKQYIKDGLTTVELHCIKLEELYIIFHGYYKSSELKNQFYPMMLQGSKFKSYILDNFKPHTPIDQLAYNINMSRSTFDRKFKEEFGTTPLKWIERQTSILIQRKASEPNVTVKDIMYEVGVYNSSQFTKLCRRLCGVTPSALIRAR